MSRQLNEYGDDITAGAVSSGVSGLPVGYGIVLALQLEGDGMHVLIGPGACTTAHPFRGGGGIHRIELNGHTQFSVLRHADATADVEGNWWLEQGPTTVYQR